MARHSPCIGICKLDEATGYCLGCGRTGAEVGDWIAMTEAQRDAVWEKLPARLAKVSAHVRLLPMTCDELVDWIAAGLKAGSGRWLVGPPGASAEFPERDGTVISISAEPGALTARSGDASLRVMANEKVRAFAFANGGPIVLGLPKGRAAFPTISTIQALGPDLAAVDEARRGDELFDLGLGRRYSRACLRAGDAALKAKLSDLAGRQWAEVLPLVRDIARQPDVHWIVESAAARVELYARDAQELIFPEILESGGEFAARFAPPDYAAPIATFYPREI